MRRLVSLIRLQDQLQVWCGCGCEGREMIKTETYGRIFSRTFPLFVGEKNMKETQLIRKKKKQMNPFFFPLGWGF